MVGGGVALEERRKKERGEGRGGKGIDGGKSRALTVNELLSLL